MAPPIQPVRVDITNDPDETQPIKIRPIKPLEQTKLPNFWIMIFTAYIFGIFFAEVLATLYAPQVGLVCHGVLLLILFVHGALSYNLIFQRMLITLALAPLIRFVSLTLPANNDLFYFHYLVLAGGPLLISALMVVKYSDLKLSDVGFRLSNWPVQILVGFSGLGLGTIEFLILRPSPLVSPFTLIQVWLPALISLVFIGILEELIFRGLMQRIFIDGLGRFRGVLSISFLYSILHTGYHSVLNMLFVFIVALFFGWVVLRTKSIVGVALAHGLTNIGLFLVIPFLVSSW